MMSIIVQHAINPMPFKIKTLMSVKVVWMWGYNWRGARVRAETQQVHKRI